jgi:hypothetical protein
LKDLRDKMLWKPSGMQKVFMTEKRTLERVVGGTNSQAHTCIH